MISNNARICNFLAANITGEVENSHENFIVRSTLDHWYPVNRCGGVFHLHYSVINSGIILTWRSPEVE